MADDHNVLLFFRHLKGRCMATNLVSTSGSAMAEGPRDALVSRNSATTKYPYRMAIFA